MRHYIFGILIVGMAMAWAGCGEEQAMTETERRRLTLDQRAVTFLLQAQQAQQQGSYQVALALTDSAEQYAPDFADIHFLRGHIYTALNQLQVANAAYEAALEADPAYRGAHMNLGVNLLRRGQVREGIGQLQREADLEPQSDLYLEMGRAYAKLGEADSARIAYEQAVALDSTNATAFMWLGQLYEEMGEFDQALAYSKRGATLRPDNLDYRYIIGSQLFRMGAVEEAVEYLRPVAEERPWHHGAQYNLGQALVRTGQEAEGQRFLDRAEVAQELQQEVNEAQDAINSDPDDLRNWLRLMEAQRKSGRVDRAAEALKVAVTMEPANLKLQTNLATLMLQSGDTTGAIRRYHNVLYLDSTYTDAWLNLGVAYGNSGQYEEARWAWTRALAHAPKNPEAKAYLRQLDQLAQAQ